MAVNKNFVVKRGLEVATDLIFANSSSVGIGTTNPSGDVSIRRAGITSIVMVTDGSFRKTRNRIERNDLAGQQLARPVLQCSRMAREQLRRST